MKDNLVTHGYLTSEELAEVLPSVERLAQGPIAVLECVQNIPCNPCEAACPFKAISVGQIITALPVLDSSKCVGCGRCVAQCPGLAIFVIDCSGHGEEGTVCMPYEFLPLPKINEVVYGLDRKGDIVTTCKVATISQAESNAQTTVITIKLPKKFANVVRNISRIGRSSCE